MKTYKNINSIYVLDSSTETQQECNYKRPRGRAKKGFYWNTTTGYWEQINGKNPKKKQKNMRIKNSIEKNLKKMMEKNIKIIEKIFKKNMKELSGYISEKNKFIEKKIYENKKFIEDIIEETKTFKENLIEEIKQSIKESIIEETKTFKEKIKSNIKYIEKELCEQKEMLKKNISYWDLK